MRLFTDGRTWYRLPDEPLPAGDLRLADLEGRVVQVSHDAAARHALDGPDANREVMAHLGTTAPELIRQVLERVSAGSAAVDVDAPPGEALEGVEAAAKRLLARFVGIGAAQASALAASLLQPQPTDYAVVFEPPFRETAQRFYAGVWAQLPAPTANPGQTETTPLACTVAELKLGGPRASEFPGGYSRVAEHLREGPIWVRWRYTEPNRTVGMAYDGLVWVGDHWAWFPKPWKAR